MLKSISLDTSNQTTQWKVLLTQKTWKMTVPIWISEVTRMKKMNKSPLLLRKSSLRMSRRKKSRIRMLKDSRMAVPSRRDLRKQRRTH